MALAQTLKARWFGYSLLALLCWGGFALLAKLGSREIPPPAMQFLFTLGAVPVALGLLVAQKFKLEKSAKGIFYGVLNGILSAVGGVALFAAYRTNQSTSVITTASSLYPVITVLLAVTVLREKVRRHASSRPLLCCHRHRSLLALGAFMIHVAPWFWFVGITLLSWGVVGMLQKVSTHYISSESSLIWMVAGYLLLEPFLFPGNVLFRFSYWNLMWALTSGALNALGAWALFAAFSNGGQVSVVAPLTALYPLVVILLAPIVLHEALTGLQIAGLACSLAAVVCLSA